MLAQADFERVLALALGECAPAWEIVGECAPVDPLDPDHWGAGSHSFQVTLRHRLTRHRKVLGRRVAREPDASANPAVALPLIGAYRHGNPEPIRRYFEEIGLFETTATDAPTFLRRPPIVTSPRGSETRTAQPATAQGVDELEPSRRAAGATPKWSRREPAVVESRGRVLHRLRRELQIWQWRRSAGNAVPSTPTRKD